MDVAAFLTANKENPLPPHLSLPHPCRLPTAIRMAPMPKKILFISFLGKDSNCNRYRCAGVKDANKVARSAGDTKVAITREENDVFFQQRAARQIGSKIQSMEAKYRAAMQYLGSTGEGITRENVHHHHQAGRRKYLQALRPFNPVFADRASKPAEIIGPNRLAR
ncbi:hypothetical protein DFS34DRAFT_663356 [Phlyctochytrium arcticum]|nr:hypothetical protein DFS34DRAFT_663356 [Phlyctochytrium arcticum]